MTIEQIIDKVKENNPGEDTALLELAYDFANKAHAGQNRKSGEPYIEHPLQTAYILAQMKADLNTITAGLLHDVPEDTAVTLEEIKKDFGDDVATLVEGITKLSKVKYRGVERYVESLRKMFLAMAQDIRVILIKFADRFHNLRTLDALSANKRERIARETLEIYAPIAGLLGVWRLKWQMEDLCFKYLYPDDFKKLEYKYEVERKVERNQYIKGIGDSLNKEFKKAGLECEIGGRFKHLYSIWRKMQDKDRKFDEIYDVFALRIIVSTVADCYRAVGIIHSLWKPKSGRFKDYIAVPKPNGYRSLHTTVFGPEGRATEFQIRTREMNEEALYGVAAHWQYKQHQGHKEDKKLRQPAWIKEILELQHQHQDSTKEFVKQVKFDVFRNRIFVFTPDGDVIDLPEGSTVIDFAYAVHTDIGSKATGAIINDKIGALDQILKNGDSIEIIIDKKRKGPNRDWLDFVKTHRARSKIKQFISKNYSWHMPGFGDIKKYIPGMGKK
jgi:GTP pyrophosphokinase